MSVPILTITAAMAAYAFARVRFPLRTPIFYLFLAGTMIPIHVTLIPLFELMRNIGLLGNALTLPLGILNTTSSLGLNKLDQLFAGLTTATLPILVFYFLAQRTITKSLTAGALKG